MNPSRIFILRPVATALFMVAILLAGLVAYRVLPLSALPGWMSAIGRCLPLTHGIMAARDVAAGAPLADVSGLVWTELGIGAAYAGAAYFLFRFLERETGRSFGGADRPLLVCVALWALTVALIIYHSV